MSIVNFSFRGLLFLLLTTLAILSSFTIFSYIVSTSRLLIPTPHDNHNFHLPKPINKVVKDDHVSLPKPNEGSLLELKSIIRSSEDPHLVNGNEIVNPIVRSGTAKIKVSNWSSINTTDDHISIPKPKKDSLRKVKSTIRSFEDPHLVNRSEITKIKFSNWSSIRTTENYSNNDNEVFHDKEIFLENYKQMNRTLKIYVYPHSPNDPFANVLLPPSRIPGGNYASESYFKMSLMKSHLITKHPSEADLFFLPFSIASMRQDKRIGVSGIPNFVRDYISNISSKYPYWNRTGGADHFYVACHSIGKVAMEKAIQVRVNAIQVVCTSNYFVAGYVPHKDVSLPQIWPRQGDPPLVEPTKRNKLAFFAGASNAPVRKYLVEVWKNDKDIFAHPARLKTPYSTQLLDSKFCLHAKGYEVNTARVGDAIYYGCVPVILADHYDLPWEDILNWKSFSVVVAITDIPNLKKILQGITFEEYVKLQNNVLKVRTHFQWHEKPVEFDAFYMAMYELWLRRSSIRIL